MKYGVIVWGKEAENLGDILQSYMVLGIYKELGIDKKDIIFIKYNQIGQYEGDEKIVLPIVGYFNHFYNINIFPLPNNIIPIFYGFHCTDEKVLQYLKAEYRYFGCRDMETVDAITKWFFDEEVCVYMSGCVTMLLPQREKKDMKGKVFLVDVRESLRPFIPQSILENSIEQTQMFSVEGTDNECIEEAYKKVESWIRMYGEQAELVVTSRLHVAIPCIALGVPVIVAADYNNDIDRFCGYENYIHVYKPHEYNEINWNPQIHNIEELKNVISDNLKKWIDLYGKGESIEKVPEQLKNNIVKVDKQFRDREPMIGYRGEKLSYLSQRQKEDYYFKNSKSMSIVEYILGKKLNDLTIIIWGAGNKGIYMARRYQHILNNCKDFFWVDENPEKQKKMIHGKPICSPQIITEYDSDKICIIVAVKDYYGKNVQQIVRKLENEFGLMEEQNFLILEKIDESARMAIDEIGMSCTLM